VAQHYKIRVVSITLFLFGGLARIEREPSNAIQEFNIDCGTAGQRLPRRRFFWLNDSLPYSQTVGALATWLCRTNAPSPFSSPAGISTRGGRIFAHRLGTTKNFEKGERVAGASGKLIAYAMILFGAYGCLLRLFNRIWTGHRLVLLKPRRKRSPKWPSANPRGLSAADVMTRKCPRPGHITLEDTARSASHGRPAIRVSDDRLVGMITLHPQLRFARRVAHNSVQAAMIPRDKNLVDLADEPLLKLLERLLSADVNQMPVVAVQRRSGPRSLDCHARLISG